MTESLASWLSKVSNSPMAGAAAKLGLPRTKELNKMARFGICRPVASEAV